MSFPKEQPVVDQSAERASRALPHERDETADSQASEPREIIKQAKKDLDNGLVDTDRGPVVDELYEEQFHADKTASAAPSAERRKAHE